MFATSSRLRRHGEASARAATQESVAPPPPGSDSCFGVRSLNGSVQWTAEREGDGQGDQGVASDPVAMLPSVQVPDIQGEYLPQPEVARGEAGATEMGGDPLQGLAVAEVDPPTATIDDTVPAPSSPQDVTQRTIRSTIVPSPIRVPSPALFLPILSTSMPPSALHSPPADLGSPPAVSDYSTDANAESDDESHSAPPSPTSLNSMPSYLASEMSMSMPSSPGMGYSTDPGSVGESDGGPGWSRGGGVGAVLQALERERARSGITRRQGARRASAEDIEHAPDLVIPMLSLPSSSLHMSLRPYEGRLEGLKIALVGDIGDTKAFLRALGEREELVDMGRQGGGGVGVIRGGKLEVILTPGTSVAQIKQSVVTSYAALHGLLNPAAAKGDQTKLRDMVARYADREDWLHAYLCVGDVEETGVDLTPLDGLLHVLPIPDTHIPTAEEATRPSSSIHSSPTVHMDDPTPLAGVESSSYFTHPLTELERTVSPILELPAIISPFTPALQALQSALDSHSIRETSIDDFLAWRPAPLDSSQSSLDTQPSAGTGTSGSMGLEKQPMPTVARAQGGGEWEAGLSRRVAKRREGGEGAEGSSGTAAGQSPPNRASATGVPGGKRWRSKGTGGPKAMSATSSASPLFPPTSAISTVPVPHRRSSEKELVSQSGPGLGTLSLLERTFAPLKAGLKGWKRVLVVAAIVGAVGWGWWMAGR